MFLGYSPGFSWHNPWVALEYLLAGLHCARRFGMENGRTQSSATVSAVFSHTQPLNMLQTSDPLLLDIGIQSWEEWRWCSLGLVIDDARGGTARMGAVWPLGVCWEVYIWIGRERQLLVVLKCRLPTSFLWVLGWVCIGWCFQGQGLKCRHGKSLQVIILLVKDFPVRDL